MGRAISVTELLNKKRKLFGFTDEWLESFGNPEIKGSWLFWADSGSGKTTFLVMLAKYLSRFGRVIYNSLEEGDSETMKQAVLRVDLTGCKRRIIFLDKETLEDLKIRLRKKKSPRIVIIDSVQYTGITFPQYKAMLKEFPEVLFIWISHEDGKMPEGVVAKRIRYHSNIKGRIYGYRVLVKSRYGSQKPFVTWPEGAEKFDGLEF